MNDKQYRVIVDTEGSDKGAEMMVKGAAMALEKYPALLVSLAGDKEKIEGILAGLGLFTDGALSERVEIIPATQVITNYDSPATAIFEKSDSSLVKALSTLAEGDEYIGVVSTGNTGALIAGTMRFLSTPDRVRPALAAVLPAEDGSRTCLVDTGATVDCTPTMLLHFARLGSDFMRKLYKLDSPKIGLLSNGSEPTKGNKTVKETHELLKAANDLNFIGNIEGTNALSGECDVLVCDGFAGNQVLKVTEGTARRIITDVARLAKKTGEPKYMELVGYLKGLYDFNSLGGAVILGARKLVLKAHGSANETSIMNTIGILMSVSDGGTII
jgi:glycerol-3-phosphate acyltransferase PlsX